MAGLLTTLAGVDGFDSCPLTSLSGFLMVGAALHPSMRTLTGQPLRPVAEMSPKRVLPSTGCRR